MKDGIKIPNEVQDILTGLTKAGFEAYIVGGCVRDLMLGREPSDWDVTTNAKPEEVQKIFPDSFYSNQFLTVSVKTKSDRDALNAVEVTTYRAEGTYTDKRHPDEVRFAQTLEEDLARRDFTMNAMALEKPTSHSNVPTLIDPFGGEADIKKKLIRAVGEPEKRFDEDALRMLRAARLATKLGFTIEPATRSAAEKLSDTVKAVSYERIRDEFIKIIETPRAKEGIELMRELGLLKHVVPELEAGFGVTQNKHHIYTVWEHNLRALEFSASQNHETIVRIAALFHDIAKPHTKQGEGPNSTFYGHDVVGAKMSYDIMTRLKFPREDAEKVSKLVRWHLFNYKLRRDVEDEIRKELGEKKDPMDPEDASEDDTYTTDASIRRLIRNVGEENIHDLVKVRMCDRIGSGVPKAAPYRLRHFQYRVEKILREHEAVRVTMLAVGGEDIMGTLDIKPGPRVGHILNALLEEVLDEPAKNTKETLTERAKALNELTDDALIELRKKAEEKVDLIEGTRDAEIKKKYWVK